MEILTSIEAYKEAIKTVVVESEFDFDTDYEFYNHGRKARIEVIPKARYTKHYLYILNEKYGFLEAKMSINDWQKTEREYLGTYIKSHKAYEASYENVKNCLSLLLIRCEPKNFSDYPKIIQDEWIHLGFNFCTDLFSTVKSVVEESDWKDWGPYWRNRYYQLEQQLRREGRKVPEEDAEQDP